MAQPVSELEQDALGLGSVVKVRRRHLMRGGVIRRCPCQIKDPVGEMPFEADSYDELQALIAVQSVRPAAQPAS